MPEQDISDLKVKLASLEGAVLTEIRHLVHDVKNIDAKLAAFVPRREAEATHDELKERVTSLEKDREWAVKNIIRVWLAGFMTVAAGAWAFLSKGSH
jgi:hypothetical protein